MVHSLTVYSFDDSVDLLEQLTTLCVWIVCQMLQDCFA